MVVCAGDVTGGARMPELSVDAGHLRTSVVIPVKDDAPLLARCLAALAAQTVPPDEVIIVDNGSSDDSAAVALAAGARVIPCPVPGSPAAASTGYDAAREDLVLRLDADCMPAPTWVAEVREAFSHAEQVAAFTGRAHFTDGPRALRAPLALLYLGAYAVMTGMALGHLPLFGSNLAFRRSAWEHVKDHVHREDAEVHDDLDLAFHLGDAFTIARLPGSSMGMSMRPLTQGAFGRRVHRGFRSVMLHWPEDFPPRRWRRLVARRRLAVTPRTAAGVAAWTTPDHRFPAPADRCADGCRRSRRSARHDLQSPAADGRHPAAEGGPMEHEGSGGLRPAAREPSCRARPAGGAAARHADCARRPRRAVSTSRPWARTRWPRRGHSPAVRQHPADRAGVEAGGCGRRAGPRGLPNGGTPFPRILVWAEFEDRRTGSTFLAINAHLDPLSARSPRPIHRPHPFPSPRGGTADDRARGLQRRTAIGDPAAHARRWAAHRLLGRRAEPAHAGVGHPCELPATRLGARRIDGILTTPDIEVRSTAIDGRRFSGVFPSDHLPVHGILRIGGAA